jgi:hypothetical protein
MTHKSTAKNSVKSSGKKSIKKGTKKKAGLEDRQWNLPASYKANGKRVATLRDLVDPDVPTMNLAELSPKQRAEIVAKRIEQQPKFQIAMVGAGILDKKRAISEVKAQTSIGRVLMEIEQRVINHQLAKAAEQPLPAPPSTKKKAPKKQVKKSAAK